jgi:hypothetical protein
VPVSVGEGDGVPVSVGEGDGVPVSVGEGDGVPVSVGEGDGVPVSVGEGDGVPVSVGDGLGGGVVVVFVGLGEGQGEPVEGGLLKVKNPPASVVVGVGDGGMEIPGRNRGVEPSPASDESGTGVGVGELTSICRASGESRLERPLLGEGLSCTSTAAKMNTTPAPFTHLYSVRCPTHRTRPPRVARTKLRAASVSTLTLARYPLAATSAERSRAACCLYA